MPTADHLGAPPRFAERAARVFRNRWLMLLLIACGVMSLVVVSVVGFSGAYFSSRSSSPDNTFTAAKITLTIARSGQVLDGSGFSPGVSRTGNQTVTNVDHSAAVTLAVSGLTSSPLADVLKVAVTETSPSTSKVYEGSLSGFGTVALGTFAAAEQRSYQIVVSWPAAQDAPSLQGAQVSFSFDWRAASVP